MPLPERNLCLPQDTRSALTPDLNGCHNLGLLLDRFAPWAEYNGSSDLTMRASQYNKKQQKDDDKTRRGGAAKGLWLRDRSVSGGLDPVLNPNSRINWDLLEQVSQRWEKSVQALGGQTFRMKVDYRLVVGFGAEHVLETSLCLHRIYGFPYIPGSAVKGVTRTYNFWRVADTLQVPVLSPEEEEERRKRRERTPLEKLEDWLSEGEERKQPQLLNELRNDPSCPDEANIRQWQNNRLLGVQRIFQTRFGTTQAQGQVIFFDAFPIRPANKRLLKLDVLNPHMGKYYQGSQPPANYLDPVPTYFLTVESGTIFQFAVAASNAGATEEATASVQRALADLGIGGKTASGYGYMNP